MSFLVIVLSLVITATWLKGFDRFDDTWFSRYQRGLRGLTLSALGEHGHSEASKSAAVIPVYLLLLIAVWLLQSLVAGVLYGLATMVLHVLVLLFAMDRTQPSSLIEDFFGLWQSGDDDACESYLRDELNLQETVRLDSSQAQVAQFKRLLIYRSFERMFMMYTLYMLLGPSGVVLGYVSYQLRFDLKAESERELAARVGVLIHWMEWVPLRLLALTFALVGDFNQCYGELRRGLWATESKQANSERLLEWAQHAVCDPALFADDAHAEDAQAWGPGGEQAPQVKEAVRSAANSEVQALRGLLERSQLVWLVVFALVTVAGW